MTTKIRRRRVAARKSAPQKPVDRETAAAIKRFEKRYGETLDRLAKR